MNERTVHIKLRRPTDSRACNSRASCNKDSMQISIERSTRKANKLMATIGDQTVHFGAVGYEDFTTHKDPARKAQYLSRHRTNEDWTLRGLRTAGFWARHLLWSEPTLARSVAALNRKFPMIRAQLRG